MVDIAGHICLFQVIARGQWHVECTLSPPRIQEGWTALMAASRRGHFDIVDQLLSHGADPDMKDDVKLSCTHSTFSDCA